uniref:Protein krueppel n=1 Tax=Anopheles christyi TaxID=43041 RepID=A0A182JWY7_9DIPT
MKKHMIPENQARDLSCSMPKKRKHYERPKALCECCGKVVANYYGHILTHREASFSCPHWPVKMTDHANFAHHVRAVHEKRIIRSCELCDKGFTHVASHVSHMNYNIRTYPYLAQRSHHGIGKIHECSVCFSKFKHPSGLNSHIKTVHRNETHTCATCGKLFRTSVMLRKHYRSHSTDQPYECRQCTKRFKSSYARRIHELTHEGVLLRCTHCEKSYRYKAQLMIHMRRSHPDNDDAQLLLIVKTLHSSFTIEDVRRFTGIQIHPDDTLRHAMCFECMRSLIKCTNFRYSCIRNDTSFHELCSRSSTSGKQEMEKDIQDADPLEVNIKILEGEIIRTVPNDEDTFVPNQDLSTFPSQDIVSKDVDLFSANNIAIREPLPDKLTRQEAVTEEMESPDDNVNDFTRREDVCDKFLVDNRTPCPKTNRYNKRQYETVKQITREESACKKKNDKEQSSMSTEGRCARVLCSICGKLVSNMSFHKLSHVDMPTKLSCPHCPAQLAHQKNLTRHIKTVHLKIVKKTCEICGKDFTTNNSYVAHMDAQHYTGEALECNKCFKKFKHATNLRSHVYAMHSGKRYCCGICDKSFKSSGLLKNHQRVHSADQPYGCSQCPKRFKSTFARKTHEMTHSGVQFQCALCDKSYRYKSLLSIHTKNMHPDKNSQGESFVKTNN